MTDVVDKETRSRMMAGIGGKNTSPELVVRKGLFKLRFRYRLHASKLPGRPDLTFAKHNAIILVNGCFWHQHECSLFKLPASNTDFWETKLGKNRARDRRNVVKLKALGWRVAVVWECALRGRGKVASSGLLTDLARWLCSEDAAIELSELPPPSYRLLSSELPHKDSEGANE
jgi:DNA mismatch endonuclease (patch repair protein)